MWKGKGFYKGFDVGLV